MHSEERNASNKVIWEGLEGELYWKKNVKSYYNYNDEVNAVNMARKNHI